MQAAADIYIYIYDMQAAAATAPHLTTVTTRVRRERSVWNIAARWLQGRKKNGVGLEADGLYLALKRERFQDGRPSMLGRGMGT